MFYDPTGHFAISALIIGAIIGAVIGFRTAAYIDYKDDGQIFNGSVKWYDYLGATVLGGAIGAVIGAGISYVFPYINSFLGTTFQIGSYMTGMGELVAVTATGAEIAVGLTALAGIGIMFSKHRPGMTHKPPFSWVTQEEGIESMLQNNLDANKAADQIMNNHVDGWKRGAGQDHNVIKKWLDRIIRKLIKK